MAKRSTKKGAARTKRGDKKAIASYEHEDKERTNNPPVGLVTRDVRLGCIYRARPVTPSRPAEEPIQCSHHSRPQRTRRWAAW